MSHVTADADGLDVFYLFHDSPLRREALRQPPGSAHRYVLFGLDQHVEQGVRARHNLEAAAPPPGWSRALDRGANELISAAGGYGGNFAGVLRSLREISAADTVFATVDTVGLPFALLNGAGLARRPAVYAAIGLAERLERVRPGRVSQFYRDALRRMETIVAYSSHEVDVLCSLIDGERTRFEFVPFGVDTRYFRPREADPEVDVVSVGADPHRDFRLLFELATRHPALRVRVVTTAGEREALGPAPPNVEVEVDIPFEAVRDRLAAARVVALPVRPNTYSGATTVLLQALALGQPVVVSRIAAVAHGYGLEDGVACRLVEPGDTAAFESALLELLSDETAAGELGRGGRAAAERLSWDRYAGSLLELLRDAASR